MVKDTAPHSREHAAAGVRAGARAARMQAAAATFNVLIQPLDLPGKNARASNSTPESTMYAIRVHRRILESIRGRLRDSVRSQITILLL